MTKLLENSPILTDYDFGMYMRCCSAKREHAKARDGWRSIQYIYGRYESSPYPRWTSKVRPVRAKIAHHSYFCIHLDSLGFSKFPLDTLKEEWDQIVDWHESVSKKFQTNICTSYIEALLRKEAYDDATRFVFGTVQEKDVVRKYQIKIDQKFIRTYVSFFKRIHPNSESVLEQFRKKWPRLEIDLKYF